MLITIPDGFTIGTSCQSTPGICSVVNSTTYKITAPGKSLNNFVVSMENVLLNSFTSESSSFSVAYSYNGNNISVQS
jgi:hypothetical protein